MLSTNYFSQIDYIFINTLKKSDDSITH